MRDGAGWSITPTAPSRTSERAAHARSRRPTRPGREPTRSNGTAARSRGHALKLSALTAVATAVRKLFAVLLTLALAGCYGRASPTTCRAKYIRDGRGDADDTYEMCMDRYARGQQLREEVRLGLRPSRAATVWRTIGAVAVAAAVAKNGGTIVVVPDSSPPQNQEAEDLPIATRPSPAAAAELSGSLSVPEVVVRVEPAVVLLETQEAFGSGFHIGHGFIVTNHHVVDEGLPIFVKTSNGVTMPGTVVNFDAVHDLALIQVPLSLNAALPLGAEQVQVGEAVVAFGAPRGLEGTVSTGIISAQRRIEDTQYIQHTSPISQGSSGGPVVNMHGRVLGVHTRHRIDGQNLNFAVDVTHVIALVRAMIREREGEAASASAGR